MSRFGSRPEEFFDDVYRDTPPWDIGGPQPALLDVLRLQATESDRRAAEAWLASRAELQNWQLGDLDDLERTA